VTGADPTARVLVADDHDLVRRLLRTAIGAHPELEIVGEAADGSQALQLARELTPDVVVLDLSMPELDGFQVAGVLREEAPDCAILVFSDLEAEERALQAGADRFLDKGAGFAAAAQAAAELAVSARRQ
jgi:DNA-binding NarL/FixJ family response regulator